jgi:hypothetical protein
MHVIRPHWQRCRRGVSVTVNAWHMRRRIHACQRSQRHCKRMSYEEEDTCMSYEEEDTCMSEESASL